MDSKADLSLLLDRRRAQHYAGWILIGFWLLGAVERCLHVSVWAVEVDAT